MVDLSRNLGRVLSRVFEIVNINSVLAPCDELVPLVEEVSVLDLAQKSHFDRHPDHIKALVHEYKFEVIRNHQIQLQSDLS